MRWDLAAWYYQDDTTEIRTLSTPFTSHCKGRPVGDACDSYYTPLSHRPKQIHPKQIPKQKRCRNRRPQANKTLKTTSPSTPLEKFIPKQKSIKSPSKHRKSYVPKHWLITPQANPKQTLSKPQANSKESDLRNPVSETENPKYWVKKESPTPSKPQAKFTSPQANLRFQLAPKNLAADPKQN